MVRRFGLFMGVILAAASAVAGPRDVVFQLRVQLAVKQDLLADRIKELEDLETDLEQAWARVSHLSSDLARAHDQGESLQSLQLREADLRLAEAELEAVLGQARDLRAAMISLEQEIDLIGRRIEALRNGPGRHEDPLSGRWRLAVDPGGLEGEVRLELDGTLVTGVYTLSGGWYGSLKGTLVGDKLRLERIDSQLGFAAILYGQLFTAEDPPRIQGTWEATNLSAGLPSSGTWIATRIPEPGSVPGE